MSAVASVAGCLSLAAMNGVWAFLSHSPVAPFNWVVCGFGIGMATSILMAEWVQARA